MSAPPQATMILPIFFHGSIASLFGTCPHAILNTDAHPSPFCGFNEIY